MIAAAHTSAEVQFDEHTAPSSHQLGVQLQVITVSSLCWVTLLHCINSLSRNRHPRVASSPGCKLPKRQADVVERPSRNRELGSKLCKQASGTAKRQL